jgi:hypothetical protein
MWFYRDGLRKQPKCWRKCVDHWGDMVRSNRVELQNTVQEKYLFLFQSNFFPRYENRSYYFSARLIKRWRLGGEEVELLLILDLDTRWWWVVSGTPRPRFAPGIGPAVPIVQEAGWALEPVWTQRLEEKFFAPAGDRTPIARPSSP